MRNGAIYTDDEIQRPDQRSQRIYIVRYRKLMHDNSRRTLNVLEIGLNVSMLQVYEMGFRYLEQRSP